MIETHDTINTVSESWLVCKLDKGMFSDEMAVTYPPDSSNDGWLKSVFVPSVNVEGLPGSRGRVRVRVIRKNGFVMAVLPSATQDIVTVNEGDVSPR